MGRNLRPPIFRSIETRLFGTSGRRSESRDPSGDPAVHFGGSSGTDPLCGIGIRLQLRAGGILKALVTGGTRGIGAAIAESLLCDGHEVTVTGTTRQGQAPAGCVY